MRAALRPWGDTLLKETFAIVYWVLIIWTTKRLAAYRGVLLEYERLRPMWCGVAAVRGGCGARWLWARACTQHDDNLCAVSCMCAR